MQAILKIISAFVDLVELVIGSVQRKRQEQDRADIRRDPVSEFDREFNGLRDDAGEADVHGDKADPALTQKE